MNKKMMNIVMIIVLFLLIFLSFKNYMILPRTVMDFYIIFMKTMFPFVFITLIINNLLIECNFPYYFNKIFHNKYIYILIMSALSGAPNNAIIIKKFLDEKIITTQDASYLISFTTFNSPLFLYYYFNLIFNDHKIIILMFMLIYVNNIIIFFSLRKKLSNYKYEITKNNNTFFRAVTASISQSVNSILNIYATIMFFQIICDLTLPRYSLLRGFIEVTQGLNIISQLNVSIKIKELLTLVILSFSGFSIHIQICSILQDYHINYKYFYLSRICIINPGII